MNFLKNNHLDVCGTAAFYFGDKKGKKKLLFNSPTDVKTQLLFRGALMHPTVLGKREIFIKNPYDNNYICAQDFELWSRISGRYRMGIYNKCLLNYRVHQKQASKEKSELQAEFAKKIIRRNAATVTGEYDEKIFRCLWFLSGREKISKANYKEFSQLIDYTIAKNQLFRNYDTKSMKKIFYNRFFEQVIKNRILVTNTKSLAKILRTYNAIDLAHNLLNRI